MDDAIFIDGKRIYLRPLDMNDLEIFHKWFNNPEIREFLGTPFPITKSDEKDILEKMTKSKDDVYLSIVVKKDKKLIGNMGLHKISRTNRNAMLGITIGDLTEASKGYGTEAMELMIDYGFNVLNLHRIYLGVHEFNERGIKAYRKLGFIEEGRKREGAYINGKYHDVVMMSILKDEWKKVKNH